MTLPYEENRFPSIHLANASLATAFFTADAMIVRQVYLPMAATKFLKPSPKISPKEKESLGILFDAYFSGLRKPYISKLRVDPLNFESYHKSISIAQELNGGHRNELIDFARQIMMSATLDWQAARTQLQARVPYVAPVLHAIVYAEHKPANYALKNSHNFARVLLSAAKDSEDAVSFLHEHDRLNLHGTPFLEAIDSVVRKAIANAGKPHDAIYDLSLLVQAKDAFEKDLLAWRKETVPLFFKKMLPGTIQKDTAGFDENTPILPHTDRFRKMPDAI